MKCSFKLFLLVAAILSQVKGYAQPPNVLPKIKGGVFFMDLCTQLPTGVTTPSGTGVKLLLKGLDPTLPLQITLTYSLAGVEEDASKQHQFNYVYQYSPGSIQETMSLTFSPPRDRRLDSVQKQVPGSRIWDLRAQWMQGLEVGEAQSSVYRTNGTEVFYKATAAMICLWESEPTITSDYIFNAVQPWMYIHRVVNMVSQVGMTNEPNILEQTQNQWPGQIPTGNVPPEGIYSIGGFYYTGSYFKDRIESNFTVGKEWTLTNGQGGYFVDRYSFSRTKADRYEWVTGPSTLNKESSDESNDDEQSASGPACGHYAITSSGYMDIGYRTSDFYVVPQSLTGSPDRVSQFIHEIHPNLNTCAEGPSPNPSDVRIDMSSSDDLLFFANP